MSESVGVASSVGGCGQRNGVLCSSVPDELGSVDDNEEEIITKETQSGDGSSSLRK